MKDKKKNISSIIRYTVGIIFIIGMIGMLSEDILASLFMGIFGVSLLPVIYDKFLYTRCKIEKKSYLHIIIPIISFLLMLVFMPTKTSTPAQIENGDNNTIKNEIIDNLVKNEVEFSKNENTQNIEVSTEINNNATKEEEPEQETTTIPSVSVVEEPKNEQITSSKDINNSQNVYRTPKGKRYHLAPDCGGKNSYSTTLDSAISSGLTPCQKCAV